MKGKPKMTIEITYATRCECTIYTVDGDSWTYNHQFRNVKDATDWARVQIDDRPIDFDIEHVYVSDCETGELLAVCSPDAVEGPTATEEWEDWGYNEDEGYDPYLGCYTDDC